MSPTSAAGVCSLSAVMPEAPVRSTALPPPVETVMTPALTPAGTTRVSSCWSGVPELPSTIVRTLNVPTPRPSMAMARSLAVRPVPSSTRVLPLASTPPAASSVGTICSAKLAPLPSTLTRPVRASAGTTMLSVLPSPLALPVRVRVPSVPASSRPWNCTRVELLRPWPCSTMVCPVVAEGRPALAGLPPLALATMALKTLTGCGGRLTRASSA